jgi:hypothetical protein
MSTTAASDEPNEIAVTTSPPPPPPTPLRSHPRKRLHPAHGRGMEGSVFRFKKINFVVGKNHEEKRILSNVSGTVISGRKCIEHLGSA